MRLPASFKKCRNGWPAEAAKVVALAIVIAMNGCAAAPLALIGSVFGIAGSAVSTGSSVYSSGKLDSAEMASLDDLRTAVFLATDDLRLETVFEKTVKGDRVIRVCDQHKSTVDVTLGSRTETLTALRINVGFNGSEPTARLILARVRAHLPAPLVPSPATAGEG